MDRSQTTTSRGEVGKPGGIAPLRYALGGSEMMGHPAPPKKPRAPRLAVRHKVSGTNRRVRGG